MPPRIDVSRAEAIDGYMRRNELTWLAERASESQIVIEVGAYLGRSTRAMGDACQGVVYTVDPWDQYTNEDGSQADWILKPGQTWDDIYRACRENLADLIAAGKVVLIRKPSLQALPSLYPRLKGQKAGLVFLDGDHRPEVLRAEIAKYRKLVAPGGILAGHDYGDPAWPGVKQVVDELFPQVELKRHIWAVRL